jgi:hypothetical protein
MVLAFIAGWFAGIISFYAYLALTAQEPPYPECMDCDAESCRGCSTLAAMQDDYYRLAA